MEHRGHIFLSLFYSYFSSHQAISWEWDYKMKVILIILFLIKISLNNISVILWYYENILYYKTYNTIECNLKFKK